MKIEDNILSSLSLLFLNTNYTHEQTLLKVMSPLRPSFFLSDITYVSMYQSLDATVFLHSLAITKGTRGGPSYFHSYYIHFYSFPFCEIKRWERGQVGSSNIHSGGSKLHILYHPTTILFALQKIGYMSQLWVWLLNSKFNVWSDQPKETIQFKVCYRKRNFSIESILYLSIFLLLQLLAPCLHSFNFSFFLSFFQRN